MMRYTMKEMMCIMAVSSELRARDTGVSGTASSEGIEDALAGGDIQPEHERALAKMSDAELEELKQRTAKGVATSGATWFM